MHICRVCGKKLVKYKQKSPPRMSEVKKMTLSSLLAVLEEIHDAEQKPQRSQTAQRDKQSH